MNNQISEVLESPITENSTKLVQESTENSLIYFVEKLPSGLEVQKVKFNCSKCKKERIIRVSRLPADRICWHCNRSTAISSRSPEAKLASKLKRQNTIANASEEHKALVKHNKRMGQLNRSKESLEASKQKAKETRANWSPERKQLYKDRCRLVNLNRSAEQKMQITAKKLHTRSEWSEEKRKHNIEALKRSHWARDPGRKSKVVAKKQQTRNNWTDDQRKANSEALRNVQISKTPEEKAALAAKRSKTLLARTGYAFIVKKTYMFEDIYFDSLSEAIFYLYHKDADENIIRNTQECFEYENGLDNQKHRYFPDFKLNGNFVEIKGEQFLNKADGTWRDPYNSENNAAYEAKHQCAIANAVQIIYSKELKQESQYFRENFTVENYNGRRTIKRKT